jgi:eukaryotic translation initiation factor 2C
MSMICRHCFHLCYSPVIERFFSKGHRIMYVGADLSHIHSDSDGRISSVAVVASADDVPNRYFKQIYKQKRAGDTRNYSIENIVEMKNIMKSILVQYKTYRGFPPNAIVIYRDGISTGEFDTVFVNELTSVREACVELSDSYRPSLTYIVVSKRHHTRFFPTQGVNNVCAGTLVDSSEINHPETRSFYLNSHCGLLVVARE